MSNHNSSLYRALLARLGSNDGGLRLTTNDAMLRWIAALQYLAADDSRTETRLLSKIPKLMVRGMDNDEELFSEVNILEDDPENISDGTWWPIELWSA